MSRIWTCCVSLIVSASLAANAQAPPPKPSPRAYAEACSVLARLAYEALDASPQREADVYALYRVHQDLRKRLLSPLTCNTETKYFESIRRKNESRFRLQLVRRPSGGRFGPRAPRWAHRGVEELFDVIGTLDNETLRALLDQVENVPIAPPPPPGSPLNPSTELPGGLELEDVRRARQVLEALERQMGEQGTVALPQLDE